MAPVRFALVGVCYISEEHARLSGPHHHRDTLGKESLHCPVEIDVFVWSLFAISSIILMLVSNQDLCQ